MMHDRSDPLRALILAAAFVAGTWLWIVAASYVASWI